VQKRNGTNAQQRIIAVISGKGGSGKSTTALALAAIAFARRRRRVVLVDLDPVGGATFGAGLDPGSDGRRGTADVFGGVPAREALVNVADGFAVLAATPALVHSETHAERSLPKLLAQLADFEIVVIDTPPGFGAFVRAAAAAATQILVPIVAEPMATRTAEYVLGMLDGIGVDRDRIVGFLPTQHEARRVLSRDQLDELGVTSRNGNFCTLSRSHWASEGVGIAASASCCSRGPSSGSI
jgi:chromosome partitioning protein